MGSGSRLKFPRRDAEHSSQNSDLLPTENLQLGLKEVVHT